jgi:hypothetical protein
MTAASVIERNNLLLGIKILLKMKEPRFYFMKEIIIY